MSAAFDCPFCGMSVPLENGVPPVKCPYCKQNFPQSFLNFSPGGTVGDYILERYLGIGGMGAVFLAEQKSMKRKVALKILLSSLASNTEYLDRFFNEVKALAQIEHPNVVQAIEAGSDENSAYFSMMFIPGKDLKRYLDSGKKFSELEAASIIRQVADALNYVWERHRIIHRDIKPGNIMLLPDGDIKLMDLGISKTLKDNNDLTAAGMMVGSPTYISPEQAKAVKNIDFRADMYSLGATYYHILTGEPPFDADTSVGVIARHISEPVPDPRQLSPQLSDASVKLINKMMGKNPEDRYPDWISAIKDIDKIILTQGGEVHREGFTPKQVDNKFKLPKYLQLGWPRVAALAVTLILFIMAFTSVVQKSLREAKEKKIQTFCEKALNFAEKCDSKQRPKAIALLEKVQKMNHPEYSELAKTALENLRKTAMHEKEKALEKRKGFALKILKDKSRKLELSGNFEEAINLWDHYSKDGEFREDKKFIEEAERSLDYLKRMQAKKREGLL
jgi:serine/threonine protein kinase